MAEGFNVGFPSPATDYVERRVTVDGYCNATNNTCVIETSTGYAVIDIALIVRRGNVVLIHCDGRNQFARVLGDALITDDGEAIEGEALDGVNVLGVVTYFINHAQSSA